MSDHIEFLAKLHESFLETISESQLTDQEMDQFLILAEKQIDEFRDALDLTPTQRLVRKPV